MKTIKLVSSTIIALFLAVSISSCSGDDGEDGSQGPAGTNGINGIDGQAGADGNANVETYIFNEPVWNETGSGMYLDMSTVLTDDIINNDVILGYVKSVGVNEVYPVSGDVWVGDSYKNYVMKAHVSTDTYAPLMLSVTSREVEGGFTPNSDLRPMDWFKCIIIKSSSTTTNTGNSLAGKGSTKQQQILNNLEKNGVDVKDYNAVCNYYGISVN